MTGVVIAALRSAFVMLTATGGDQLFRKCRVQFTSQDEVQSFLSAFAKSVMNTIDTLAPLIRELKKRK